MSLMRLQSFLKRMLNRKGSCDRNTKGTSSMMSASEGGEGVMEKQHRKGGCLNYILQISSKCGQGGGGQKNRKFFGCH